VKQAETLGWQGCLYSPRVCLPLFAVRSAYRRHSCFKVLASTSGLDTPDTQAMSNLAKSMRSLGFQFTLQLNQYFFVLK
jgi:hypothetical protein